MALSLVVCSGTDFFTETDELDAFSGRGYPRRLSWDYHVQEDGTILQRRRIRRPRYFSYAECNGGDTDVDHGSHVAGAVEETESAEEEEVSSRGPKLRRTQA